MEEEERKSKKEKVNPTTTLLRKEKVLVRQMSFYLILQHKTIRKWNTFTWRLHEILQQVRSSASGSYPDLLEMVTRSNSPSAREQAGMYAKVRWSLVVENSKKYSAIVYQDSMIIQRLTWAARDRDRTVTQAPSNQTGRQQQQQRHQQGETEALILTPGDSPIPFPLLPFPKMILYDKFIFCVQFQDRLIATASSRDWCAKLHFLDNHQPSGLVTHQDPLPQWSNIKLRYCQMPAFENSLGKSHLSSSEWPLWSFRTLIDRFNSFLETEGHSDHRKPMWSCDPKERYTLFFVTISCGECPSL